jgi:hypothetical protein
LPAAVLHLESPAREKGAESGGRRGGLRPEKTGRGERESGARAEGYKQLYINWINRLLTKKKRANKVNGLIQFIHPRHRQQFSPSRPSPPPRKPRRTGGEEGRRAKPDLCTYTMAASAHAVGNSSPFGIAGEGEGCGESGGRRRRGGLRPEKTGRGSRSREREPKDRT